MSLGLVLDRVREIYVMRLQAAIQQAKKPIGEPAYRMKDGALAREGPLALPLRGDLFVDGKMISVDSETILSFEPLEFVWEKSLCVVLGPFHWDSFTPILDGVGQRADWRPLVVWFEKWFDGEVSREAGSDYLFGVAHFLSDPEQRGNETSFTIDLGSAPVTAFEELLDTIAALGASRVRIGKTEA